jgi:hypothetical protein
VWTCSGRPDRDGTGSTWHVARGQHLNLATIDAFLVNAELLWPTPPFNLPTFAQL